MEICMFRLVSGEDSFFNVDQVSALSSSLIFSC